MSPFIKQPINTIEDTDVTASITPQTKKRSVQLPVSGDEEEWGVAKEIEKGTYTIRVGNDAAMGTPQEVFNALNAYRATNGKSSLSWDDNLARYAQSRAEYMSSIKTTDQHAGFNYYLENDDGFNRLGFYQLGENSYYGGPLTGTHLIEWVFAKSPGHDANQKSSDWTHVGVGVSGSAVNLNFGGSKM
ncbi:MAG: Cysteine-rich secretory protein family protein [Microgenomates bacterium OLB23]|nr:MAG: Cysteine-rich secretory protein family protein [Microgenomates bacterium OLB23]